jgi:ABC-type Na+ efflux pump permease subunit
MVMFFSKFGSVTLSSMILFPFVFSPSLVVAQTSPSAEEIETPEIIEDTPQSLRPDSLLSLKGGEKLMTEANQAIDEENYDLAKEKLQSARRVFNQLSNFYQELAGSFQGISNQVAEEQRQQALQAAQMRDQATYQLGLVHRAQKETALAVPLFIQVIRSQNPTSELGKKSYEQLRELGFVQSPFPENI